MYLFAPSKDWFSRWLLKCKSFFNAVKNAFRQSSLSDTASPQIICFRSLSFLLLSSPKVVVTSTFTFFFYKNLYFWPNVKADVFHQLSDGKCPNCHNCNVCSSIFSGSQGIISASVIMSLSWYSLIKNLWCD